ncbi:MAG: VOC family protein [Planctomycetes bacterium]|nr:VOC family protein [Planctomycetota bacterium]NOG55804.1 VOC family protein [Planctomycetota bacterium]
MPNRVMHFEINSPDPAQTNAFFESVFNWKINKWDGPEDYWLAMTGKTEPGEPCDPNDPGIDGGIMQSCDNQPRTVNSITVDTTVDEYAEKVIAAGGQVVVPKMAVPGIGWLAYCLDPAGVLFGIFQTDMSAK